MNQSKNQLPDDFIAQVRNIIPPGRVTYGQARIDAQIQATRVRALVNSKLMRLPLDWIEQIPGVNVTLLTPDEMEVLTKRPGASGATDVKKDGTYRIYINESYSPAHCRFTLAHEFFHVITGPSEKEHFAALGGGDPDLHRRRIEQVADHFAANLLMPKILVTKAWGYGIQGAQQLADFFGVSEEAMRIRLKTVGLIRGIRKDMFYRAPYRAGRPTAWPEEPGGPLFGRHGEDWRSDDESYPSNPYEPGFRCPGMNAKSPILTVAEAAERLHVSKWTINKLIREQQIKTFKVGSRRLIAESALWELVDRLSDQELV